MDYPALHRPEDIPAVFVAAWNARDPDALASVFVEDADFVNVVWLWWHDRAAIRKAHAYGLQRIFDRSTLRATRVTVRYLADGIAVVHARLTLSGQSAVAGVSEPGQRRNIFTFVVQRQAEGWRCVAAHNTDVVPGAETNVVGDDGALGPADYRPAAS